MGSFLCTLDGKNSLFVPKLLPGKSYERGGGRESGTQTAGAVKYTQELRQEDSARRCFLGLG